MTPAPATGRSAVELAAAVRGGELRAADVVDAHLERLQAREPRVDAFLEVFADEARQRAEAIDRRRASGATLGRLAGVPIAYKDNLVRRGAVSACASRILADFRSPYTATAVERLLAADAVPLGRTNMDEFGMGSSTERSAIKPTRNPYDHTRVPGGSSGGSAAAVADLMVPLALGSDTGGSIRQPAAFCGISGLKPTYGRVSRWGLIAYASSLDTVGTLARCALDHALALEVIAGHDGRDATCRPEPAPRLVDGTAAADDLGGVVIGVPEQAFAAGLDAEVAAATEAALVTLEARGARRVAVSLPHWQYAIPTYYLIAAAEASSNLSRYDGVRYGSRVAAPTIDAMYAATRAAGFGSEVKTRILLGTFALRRGYADALYGRATRVRTKIRDEILAALAGCDLLAMPTTPTTAFRFGERDQDPLSMYLADVLTVAANLAGVPALSLPCGQDAAGLPVGLQLTAAPLAEATLLRVAQVFESTPGRHRLPPPAP